MMIDRIRREHGYMIRLLAILENKVANLKQGESINYSLIKEIVDYLGDHSERVHHPKEDLLYHYYLAHYGEQQEIENLELEHQELSIKTHAFLDVVEMILKDAVVPRDLFLNQLEDFLSAQRKHLQLEERKVLPLICQQFTVEDWQTVESQYSASEDDPVFGETIAEQYIQLAQRVRIADDEAS